MKLFNSKKWFSLTGVTATAFLVSQSQVKKDLKASFKRYPHLVLIAKEIYYDSISCAHVNIYKDNMHTLIGPRENFLGPIP